MTVIRSTVPRPILLARRHRRQRIVFNVAAVVSLVGALLFAVHWAGL